MDKIEALPDNGNRLYVMIKCFIEAAKVDESLAYQYLWDAVPEQLHDQVLHMYEIYKRKQQL